MSAATTATVNGLTNGGSYTFEVAAQSNRGTGAFSGPTAVIVIGRPGRPTIVSVAPANGGVMVSIKAPPPNGSAIMGYALVVYLGSSFYEGNGLSTASTQRIGLPNGQSFRLTVAAYNADGAGPPSALSPVVVPGSPAAAGEPVAVPGNGRATVHWAAGANNGSAITRYVITPYLGGVAQSPRTYASNATTETVAGLANGRQYTFKVAGSNARGLGSQSSASALVTVGVPTAPTGVSGSPGHLSATVHWIAPRNNGSTITGYVVTPYLGTAPQPAAAVPYGGHERDDHRSHHGQALLVHGRSDQCTRHGFPIGRVRPGDREVAETTFAHIDERPAPQVVPPVRPVPGALISWLRASWLRRRVSWPKVRPPPAPTSSSDARRRHRADVARWVRRAPSARHCRAGRRVVAHNLRVLPVARRAPDRRGRRAVGGPLPPVHPVVPDRPDRCHPCEQGHQAS